MRINPNKNFKDLILKLNQLVFHRKEREVQKEILDLLNSILKTKLNGDLKLYQSYRNLLEQLYFNFNYHYFKWVKENHPENLEREIKRFKNRDHENILISFFKNPGDVDDLFYNLYQYLKTKGKYPKTEAFLIFKSALEN